MELTALLDDDVSYTVLTPEKTFLKAKLLFIKTCISTKK